MLDMSKLYDMIPVWMTSTFSRNLCSYSVVKLHEAAQKFVIVDYIMEITSKKSCSYEEYGSLEHSLFLFLVYWYIFYLFVFSFYADFGPLNLANLYRYCCKVNKKLKVKYKFLILFYFQHLCKTNCAVITSNTDSKNWIQEEKSVNPYLAVVTNVEKIYQKMLTGSHGICSDAGHLVLLVVVGLNTKSIYMLTWKSENKFSSTVLVRVCKTEKELGKDHSHCPK